MKRIVVVLGTLAIMGAYTQANAQSLFERCQQNKLEIEKLKQEATNLDQQIRSADQAISEMNQKLRQIRSDRAQIIRNKTEIDRKIKREERSHRYRCRALRHCDRYEKRVSELKERLRPMSDNLALILDGIRQRNTEIGDLNSDIERIENQYAQLGCDNLQIGQTAQTTFDKCSQLSKDWTHVQTRISTLQASVQRLRKSYQQAMYKMRSMRVELAQLLKDMRKSCEHSQSLAELLTMEKTQDEYTGIKSKLDEMVTKVNKFRNIKLMPKSRSKHKHDFRPKNRPSIKPSLAPVIQPKPKTTEEPVR